MESEMDGMDWTEFYVDEGMVSLIDDRGKHLRHYGRKTIYEILSKRPVSVPDTEANGEATDAA